MESVTVSESDSTSVNEHLDPLSGTGWNFASNIFTRFSGSEREAEVRHPFLQVDRHGWLRAHSVNRGPVRRRFRRGRKWERRNRERHRLRRRDSRIRRGMKTWRKSRIVNRLIVLIVDVVIYKKRLFCAKCLLNISLIGLFDSCQKIKNYIWESNIFE